MQTESFNLLIGTDYIVDASENQIDITLPDVVPASGISLVTFSQGTLLNKVRFISNTSNVNGYPTYVLDFSISELAASYNGKSIEVTTGGSPLSYTASDKNEEEPSHCYALKADILAISTISCNRMVECDEDNKKYIQFNDGHWEDFSGNTLV